MYCKAMSGTLDGIDGVLIGIEADVSDGLPMFDMVGLLSSEVREAKERVRISIKNSGYIIPPKKITINLFPADVRKSGTGFDIGIAVTILCSLGLINQDSLENVVFLGELGLSGNVKRVNGVLSVIYEAYRQGFVKVIVPKDNAKEAALVGGIEVIGVESLKDIVDYLQGKKQIDCEICDRDSIMESVIESDYLDFADVAGQGVVKRAIEIAVAGMHNILIIGPPGAGKTMLAQRIPGIMPELTFEESIRLTKIYSVAGLLNSSEVVKKMRPFRAPHHTITVPALTGGGSQPTPGEISLASKGVLFLDELPEFNKDTLEILRQPLEDGYINISRLSGSYRFDADFILVCAMNPCKCGYYPDRRRCNCTDRDIHRYIGKISRPLLDRIDICVEADAIDFAKINDKRRGESSFDIKSRIVKARNIQMNRFKDRGILYNSEMKEGDIDRFCYMDSEGREMLEKAYEKYALTARGYHRIIKVARTIADLEGEDIIKGIHIAQAICYRSTDAKYWGTV